MSIAAPLLPKDFTTAQAARVLDDSARQITVRLRLNGGVDAAVVRNDEACSQKRQPPPRLSAMSAVTGLLHTARQTKMTRKLR